MCVCVVQIAYMCRGEMSSFDSCFVGPLLIVANQYFGVVVSEYCVLWLCFVSDTLHYHVAVSCHVIIIIIIIIIKSVHLHILTLEGFTDSW